MRLGTLNTYTHRGALPLPQGQRTDVDKSRNLRLQHSPADKVGRGGNHLMAPRPVQWASPAIVPGSQRPCGHITGYQLPPYTIVVTRSGSGIGPEYRLKS